MGDYTQLKDKQLDEFIDDEQHFLDNDDAYIKFAKEFRPFTTALDTFILEHGYSGDINDIESKVNFIYDSAKRRGVSLEKRTPDRWYTNGIDIDKSNRRNIFKLCFAFELDIEETKIFCSNICQTKGIDFHKLDEVVYYFCIKNKLPYADAERLIKKFSDVKKGDINPDEEIVYTETIKHDILGIDTIEKLENYLEKNKKQFLYNNATARNQIQTLWKKISDESDGLAKYEREKIMDIDGKVPAGEFSELIQILGFLDKNDVHDYADNLRRHGKERSILFIFKDNPLVSKAFSECFPSRNSLRKCLNGQDTSNDSVRKLLLLLAYYDYAMVHRKEYGDSKFYERGIDYLNSIMNACCLQELYPGNPYDWHIMFSLRSTLDYDEPLAYFRQYMRDLYVYANDKWEAAD